MCSKSAILNFSDVAYIPKHRIVPSNENALIKRSFRTDEEEFLYRHAPFSDYDDLRKKYAARLIMHNTKRPHLGIDLKTPMEVIHAIPKD